MYLCCKCFPYLFDSEVMSCMERDHPSHLEMIHIFTVLPGFLLWLHVYIRNFDSSEINFDIKHERNLALLFPDSYLVTFKHID